MKERSNLFSATGIPSLFLIFAVLMLVILSLLGYGTSREDLSSSTLSLEQTTQYYNSCKSVTDFYTDMLSALKGFQEQGTDTDEFFQLAGDYFQNIPNAAWDEKTHQVQYIQPFSKTQSLNAEFLILAPSQNTDASVRILSWNTVATSNWNPDTSQSVYKGE